MKDARGGGERLGSRGVLGLPKGFGTLMRYARFGGGCTRPVDETSAGYYWLESLCKGLIVNPCHSSKEVFMGLANPGIKEDRTCG